MGKDILVCPKGYDVAKFELICKLFAHLDTDSNRSLAVHEMSSFVNFFFERDQTEKNREMKDLKNRKNDHLGQVRGAHDEKIAKYTEKCYQKNNEMTLTKAQKEHVKSMETDRDLALNKLTHQYADEKVQITKDLELVQVLDTQERAKKLIEDMNGNQNSTEVEFKKFFQFFRDRDMSGYEAFFSSQAVTKPQNNEDV